MEQKQVKVDDNLYSRQIATFGAEAMGKLVTLKVLIHGLRGVGIETAKNLVLAGPATVHLHDNEKVQIRDLGVNFYAKEQHVGQISRAQASQPQLQELNPLVNVQVVEGDLSNDLLSKYNVVIITDFYEKQRLIEMNEFCRSNNIGFIYSGNLGLYGFGFVDYGNDHVVFDTTGEQVQNHIIVNISRDKENAVVNIHEDKRCAFSDGDTVIFREVEGMTEINGKQVKIKNVRPTKFEIELDTSSFSEYTGQGIVEQVKVKEHFAFKSLKDSLDHPFAPGRQEIDLLDYGKFGVSEQLHVLINGVLDFVAQNNNQLPELNNKEQAEKLAETVLGVNKARQGNDKLWSVEEFTRDYAVNTALYARANISPLASFWGGIIAQEAIKYTGKYTPLRQWLHYEVFETLNEDANADKTPLNSRYDDMVVIYGRDFLQKLQKQNVFMVGAGALGCEYLKMFALMGLSTDKQGKFTVTDDDQIEISNLNRQFLFRRENVGHPKSLTAANSVQKNMNNDFNVEALKSRVAPENEELFNDNFWDNLNFVVNAVDNVKARLFVDGRCVWYQKPLFESGTLGTKCNSQVILPKLTQSYGDSVDPPEQGIPLCTLKNFPNQIEHCIQYARDKFEEYLVEGPTETIKFIQDKNKWIAEMKKENGQKPQILRGKYETVKKLASAYKGGKIENLIEVARNLWQENFHNQIASLVHAYPEDAKTSEGAPFWSGPKRCPKALDFDHNDEEHINFVQSCANILANIFGQKQIEDKQQVAHIVSQLKVPQFVPKKIVIKTDEKDKSEEKAEDDEEIVAQLEKQLLALDVKQSGQLQPIEFEKDDPTNWHIDFVAAFSNLRARNYKIKEVSPFTVKIIAGKIIPALATTTAMVVGAIGLEVIKTLLGKPLEKMRNSFMNLALPMWLFSEPLPPIEAQDKEYDEVVMGPVKAIPPKFTTWDKVFVKGPLTIQQLIDHVKEKFNVEASIISCGKVCLFNAYGEKKEEDLKTQLHVFFEKLSGEKIPAYKKFLELEVNGDIDDADASMPTFKFQFRD